jgi:hypothetical protein
MLAGVVLASFTLALAILLRTLNHRATSTVLFVLLTFDIAALLLLLVS